MNKGKRGMPSQLRKKMGKEIRSAQAAYPSVEERKYSDELTAKEMLKKYPKKIAQKRAELLKAMEKNFAIKKKKNAREKMPSKRTTPGEVPSTSTPAITHREGQRWIKTLTKQSLEKRMILNHKVRGKK